MDRNRWIIFGAICVAIFGALVYFSGDNKVDVEAADPNVIVVDREINDQVFGNAQSKVVIFEYADFQCPGCSGAYQNLSVIKQEYKDKVAFVYRHFPLMTYHPHAFAAAAAAEAAGLQGKFWEMHDLIFDTQQAWSPLTTEQRQAQFEQYAETLNLDLEKFKTDIGSSAIADKINYDRSLGLKAGVNSTPSLYINGQKVADSIITDVIQKQGDEFRKLLDDAIAEANKTTEEPSDSNE